MNSGPQRAVKSLQTVLANARVYTGTVHGTTTAMCNDVLAWVNAL